MVVLVLLLLPLLHVLPVEAVGGWVAGESCAGVVEEGAGSLPCGDSNIRMCRSSISCCWMVGISRACTGAGTSG